MSIKDALIRIFEWFYSITNSRNICVLQAEEIKELKEQLADKNKEIDYSFIPDNYNEVEGDVVTDKTVQNNIPIELDIRDLFNSTVYSRRWADEVIDEYPKYIDNDDEYFNELCLAVANKTVVRIAYKTNQSQFNVSDRWNNGDATIETLEGDCDLSVRVFVRVMNDVLDKLKMYEYKKYIFQSIGFMAGVGHSWAKVYDPVSKEFRLVEATRDTPYTELPRVSDSYDLYFCLNFKKIFKIKDDWEGFL